MKKRYVEICTEVLGNVLQFRGDDDATRVEEVRLKFALILALGDIATQLEGIEAAINRYVNSIIEEVE